MASKIAGNADNIDIKAETPTAIHCPEITREGRLAYEVPIRVDGDERSPMRLSYEHGRWGNLNGGCGCHRPPGPDFQNPGDAQGPGTRF